MNEVRAAMAQRAGLLWLAIAVKLESQPRRKGILAASRIEEIGKGEVEGSLEGSWTCLSKVGLIVDLQGILQENRATKAKLA